MNQLLPRFRKRELAAGARLASAQTRIDGEKGCPSRKYRYATEPTALEGLSRVRRDRIQRGDPHPPECRIYFCDRCLGWHLTSSESHPEDFASEPDRREQETWQEYALRLEKRIARQRSEILSLHQLGHGLSNKSTRRRLETLVIAVGRATERFERERRHRIALVRLLDARCSCWWCRFRRWVRQVVRKPGAVTPEAVSATKGTES